MGDIVSQLVLMGIRADKSAVCTVNRPLQGDGGLSANEDGRWFASG